MVVYVAGLLPFLGSLLRDFVILSRFPATAVNSFFRYFYLSNLIALIPGEYIWTKYNTLSDRRIRIPSAEVLLLGLFTAAAAFIAFLGVGVISADWVLIPLFSVLAAYPIGITNGLKHYLTSKIVSAFPNVIMAGLTLVLAFRLSKSYLLSLLVTLAVFFPLVMRLNGVRTTSEQLNIRKTFRFILLVAIPFLVFHMGNFLVLSFNVHKSRLVLWGNRISNYLFTFLLLAAPVFINAIKNRPVKISHFKKYILMALAAVLALSAVSALSAAASPEAALVVLNAALALFSSLVFYVVKIVVVRMINDGSGEWPAI